MTNKKVADLKTGVTEKKALDASVGIAHTDDFVQVTLSQDIRGGYRSEIVVRNVSVAECQKTLEATLDMVNSTMERHGLKGCEIAYQEDLEAKANVASLAGAKRRR